MPQVTMKDVFVECGSSLQCHNKQLKSLQKIYTAMDPEAFWLEFVHLLKYPMVVYAREPVVERTIEFVAKFVCSVSNASEVDSDDNSLLNKLVTFLLQSHSACNQGVRFRSCQLINKLLTNLGEDAHIDDDLYNEIFSGMLERARDKLPLVRAQAVYALARLQDPTDKDCPVIKAYLFLISCDPSPDVRRAVLSCIAPSTRTLTVILDRTRDVKDAVRKTAFQIIADKIHIKTLSIAQRIQLLTDGLNDRSEIVAKTCANQLLQSWLKSFAGNVLELLKCLDVESSVEICEKALTTMFKGTAVGDLVANFTILDDKMLIDGEKLTEESAMYWCSLCRYIHSMGDCVEQLLEMVLPNCLDFCDYIHKYLERCGQCTDLYEQLEHEFVIQQLLTMTSFMDLTDQAGRKVFQKLLDDMLLNENVSHRLIKHIILRLLDLHSDHEPLVTHLAEIIADIREPMTSVEKRPGEDERRQNDLKMAGIRVQLNQLREDLDECIQQQAFVKAAELKEKISELEMEKAEISQAQLTHVEEVRIERTDPETWLKCLNIVSELLENASIKGMSPVIQTIKDSLILPGIQNADPDVRNAAVKALGLCCLLNKETALQYLVLLLQASQVDTEGVRATALHILFDLLHFYGLEVLQVEPPAPTADGDTSTRGRDTTGLEMSTDDTWDATSQTPDGEEQEPELSTAIKLLTILSSSLDLESSDLRSVAAEGLAKLLLSGRIQSAKLISRLILLWYNPMTEEDTRLRHCLGVFFPVFAMADRINQEMLKEAFMPTMRTLLNAPSSSPLANVDVNNVALLFVQLTSRQMLKQNKKTTRGLIQDHTIHDNLALQVCNEILSHPDSFGVKVLVKTLNILDISLEDVSSLKDLASLSAQMLEAVKEKVCVKGLLKFQSKISEVLDKLSLSENTESGLGKSSKENPCDETTNPEGFEANENTDPSRLSLLTINKDATGTNDEGETTANTKTGNIVKTPAPRSTKKGRSRASAKTPCAVSTLSDLENSVFLSPTPIRKSSMKTKTASTVCSDALDDSKLRLDSTSRRQSNRRVLFDVDNTSLQNPN
ncbi:condensin complex subunit 3-like [Liolophura sinensis]|uniref:condensin complex subunit 3-like n=1 Tax=Liolophura sinensis TaxID=3198878 RepID=UPI003157FE3C